MATRNGVEVDGGDLRGRRPSYFGQLIGVLNRMGPTRADVPPMASRSASFRRVSRFVRAFQVEAKGAYSPERLVALYNYSVATSWWQVIAVIVLTPLPCLATILLPEVVRLNPPSDGLAKNGSFYVRMFGSYIVFGTLVAQQVCSRLPMLPMSRRRFALIVLIVTICIEAVTYGATLLIGFPLPFTIQLGCVPHQTFLAIALSLSWFKHIRTRPAAMAYVVDAMLIFTCQGFLVVVYPAFSWALSNVPVGLPRTMFSMLLPILKILSRNLVASVCRENDERTPQTVVFNADIGNALFISYCMQFNPSMTTILCLMVVNLAQAALSMREINRILISLTMLTKEMCILQRRSLKDSETQTSTQDPLIIATDGSNDALVVQAVEIIRRYKISGQSVSTSRKLSSGYSRITGMLARRARSWRTQINPISPQNILETSIVPDVTGMPAREKQNCVSQIEALNRRYLRLVLKLMYMTEYAVAIEYVEVVVPVIYSLYLFMMLRMPNRVYYEQLDGMDSEKTIRVVGNVLLYSATEIVSLIALSAAMRLRTRFPTMKQLSFMLTRQAMYVQSTLILWVFFSTQASLEHYGSDYTFKFSWLRKTMRNI